MDGNVCVGRWVNSCPMELRFPDRPKLKLNQALCPRLMGILNITPDSFSDGGRFASVEVAVDHARKMVDDGADLIDVGGESTRPGALNVDPAEQIERVLPVISAIAAGLPELPISIDTTSARVAAAALDGGASMINDISAGRHDPAILRLAAEHEVPIVLMHMQGQPTTMQQAPVYRDVVDEVEMFLRQRVIAAKAAGVAPSQVVIDPGIGFGKDLDHNLQLLASLARFVAIGSPVLLGASRKRFIASLGHGGEDPNDRVGGTCATTALAIQAGVQLVRVHDVDINHQFCNVLNHVHDKK